MHRPPAPPAALLVAALLSMSAAVAAARADNDSIPHQAGREALGRGDGPAAVSLLESALLTASPVDRPAILEDLRLAYERAAAQAEAAGDTRRARTFRENLQIVNRSRPAPGGSPAPRTDSPPSQVPTAPAPSTTRPPMHDPADGLPPATGRLDSDESNAVADRSPPAAPEPVVLPPKDEAIVRASVAPPTEASPPPVAAPEPSEAPTRPGSQSVAELLRAADDAFRGQKYDEAGRIYETLAKQEQLPEAHRPVWAYCRFVAVAKKINAQPTSPAEWAAIHAEIREVRALAPPEIWFSEYLRRLAAERSAAVNPRPSGFIVRGQSSPNESGATVPSSPTVGSWQVMDSENFRVFHADPVLADRVVRRAEQARAELIRYWSGSEPSSAWSPRCDLYVYPDATIYSRVTGQPADSPGFSTMGLSGGRVAARRINLRADHDGLVEAVVPHEVAHVVLADLFPTQQIPRWADEGIAVLAEPTEAQAERLAHLEAPLASGRVFRSGALMTAAMPDGRYWDLFMAQSASLAQYLIQLDTPDRLVSFLRESERQGVEAALRRVYGFEDFDDLHARWLSHSRRRPATASAGAIATRTEAEERVR